MWNTEETLRLRRHSFDDFLTVAESLELQTSQRKCKSLNGLKWIEITKDVGWSCDVDSSDSEQSVVSAASSHLSIPGNQLGFDLEKELQELRPEKCEKYEQPGNAPEDFEAFRKHHNWIPYTYQDSQLPKEAYARPTPTYVWKSRRRKFTKSKHIQKKRFEILDIESDIDTEDDDIEENCVARFKALPRGQNARANHQARVNWLKYNLAPLRARRCSSDEYSESSHSDPDLQNEIIRIYPKQYQGNSSDDELCYPDRDSDYEYSHVWGESDSENPELELDGQESVNFPCGDLMEEADRSAEASLPFKRYYKLLDAPSPEPYLPQAIFDPKDLPSCVHKVDPSDILALDFLNLDLSSPHDIPRVSDHTPNFKIVDGKIENKSKVNIGIQEERASQKRKISDASVGSSVDCSVSKFARLRKQDSSSDEESSGSVSSFVLTGRKNEFDKLLKIELHDEGVIESPYPTPNSDIESLSSPANVQCDLNMHYVLK
ncbi:uncharacterized protein LOC132198562 [Neocloeon triangulifer]|uniref:uncharacterized protein LOC132198562 n=1 Tax=Neocloeon triangulifer TaxID=2078957 RepID=UPI00286EF9F7|nr:uncharacterized protein LOC132198562 [Neocloeon triangulifer]XP_059478626.1 uncharacterized protein LOC132198562 [Neocloeon triangulifer]XP_059478627.1 uncharacterized protein LOC132198562 [Neocloeon triangulifer]XP_059478628.1 uncharacterized protein LOC132198562 [Neocloeon triangulifer]XP_059478629.1 uncharacterized protein LOC132198562 [Neocloeon triangulifer]XP_059478630.1 uncharacterized protein LOC132198562 [Neocloeon triangulifer]XP_059478631.1 uncharacterized protein LOC132198562 [